MMKQFQFCIVSKHVDKPYPHSMLELMFYEVSRINIMNDVIRPGVSKVKCIIFGIMHMIKNYSVDEM